MTSLRRAIWRSSSLLLLIFALDARGEEPSLLDWVGPSGSVRTLGFSRDRSFSTDRGYLVNSLWLQARPKELGGIRGFFDANLVNQNTTRILDPVVDLREGFLETSAGAFDFKVGRQIIVWGRADKANPTDVWSVKNLTLLSSDDEDQRTGLFTTQIAWNWQNLRLISLWQPEWRAPKLPLNLPSNVTVRFATPQGRAEQFGFKLDSTGEIDWSLSYSRVIDRNPDLRVLRSGGSGTELSFEFKRTDVFGLDFAKTLGDYGLRGEASFTDTADKKGNDPLTKNPFFYGVIGIERTFGQLNLNAQYVYRHTLHFFSSDEIQDSNLRFLAQQVETLSNQRKRNFHAGTFRASYKAFHETLETELVMAGWFDNGFTRPKITYSVNDSLRAIVGAEFYRGKSDSFFGRLKPISTGFAELRYLF